MSPTVFAPLRNLSVSSKLLIIILIFSAAIAVLLGGTISALRVQQSDAAIADALGRQRFLLVRYYVDALHAAAGGQGDYKAVIATYNGNMTAMMNGGVVTTNVEGGQRVEMPAPPTDAILDDLREQRDLAAQFQTAVDRYLALPADRRQDPAVLDALRDSRIRATAKADESAKGYIRWSEDRVRQVILVELLLGIAAIAIGGLAAFAVGRSITRPLQDCVALASGIAEGNLRQTPLPVTSRDEIGALIQTFNSMMAGLRSITAESRATASQLGTAVQEILVSIQEQASSAREQAAAVQEITTTVEEIGQSAQQVAEMARDVGSTADGIAANGQSGLTAVRDAGLAMAAIRAQTRNVAETITALSERTQAIGEIISTVNEIAEQSNLVALNAAIEAAGAGEQGRRFSIVANEIKALADQAKDATKQVRTILEQTQRNISSSVLLTEEALKRVDTGREKADAAEEAIRLIAGGIQDTSGSFQQVVGATGQQQIGLEQIAQGLQQIRQASVQATSGTDQLAKAAEDLGRLGSALNRLMEKYQL